jgi:hypothetical protein
VKSMLIALPRAVSSGQAPGRLSAFVAEELRRGTYLSREGCRSCMFERRRNQQTVMLQRPMELILETSRRNANALYRRKERKEEIVPLVVCTPSIPRGLLRVG